MFKKILIANRGEIAVRVIRACREMGIRSVAVYSTADSDALHAQLADEAICIGEPSPQESYLKAERILSAAVASGAEAIHPGYGFLSENAKFARICEECKIKFIGPPADVILKMGNKQEARRTMMSARVPVTPGSNQAVYTVEAGLSGAEQIGFPVMIKAASGGGGKGMRVSRGKEDFRENFEIAQKEAKNGFGDETMYLEKLIENPRHIEVQIMADSFGNVVSLGERDCTVQRMHQKLVEEAPSPVLDEKLRAKINADAVKAAKAAGYVSAGTVEFLLDKDNKYYFMEMNTRVQVEHPVTEMTTGIDIIREQINIAAGEKLSFTQKDVKVTGHAIECRINAEDPEKNFRPCPGELKYIHMPGGNGVRIDSALYVGYTIPPYYDSMIAKLIVHAGTRDEAIGKMMSALGEVNVQGVTTNLDYQYDIISSEKFASGKYGTDFIEEMSK